MGEEVKGQRSKDQHITQEAVYAWCIAQNNNSQYRHTEKGRWHLADVEQYIASLWRQSVGLHANESQVTFGPSQLLHTIHEFNIQFTS